MVFKNGEWDAIRLSSPDTVHINAHIYNNRIYNCGHDAISFVGVIGFEAYKNKIYSTRTNSGLRATDCDSIYFHHNIIGNSIGNPSSGYAGIILQNSIVPVNFAEINNNTVYGKNGGIHIGSVATNTIYPTGFAKNVHVHHNLIYKTKDAITQGNNLVLDGGIQINGFQNTLVEHNIIDGGTTNGIAYRGNAGGGTGYHSIIRNNIIINNLGYGISNENSSAHTFIASNNIVYNNDLGNFNNTTATNDLNTDPLFGKNHSTLHKWTHVVASYDNTTETFKIYINGVEKSSRSVSGIFGNIGTNNYNLLVGTIYNLAYSFKGLQDELAIWNRALSLGEITNLYNNGNPNTISGSTTNGMQAYFQMENNWNDASGNGFDAEDSLAVFSTNAINGNFSGLFSDTQNGVQYPTNLSTTNGITISTWFYRTELDNDIQTLISKGKQSDNNNIWLYFRGESLMFELGNGNGKVTIEAYITNPEDLDYHIKSENGRWDNGTWVNDLETSPCLDNGNGSSDFSNETNPNGGIVNIGLYGNTVEASKSQFVSVLDSEASGTNFYPNPTSNEIKIPTQYIGFNYKIMSAEKIITSGKLTTTNLEIGSLKNGCYYLIVENQNTDTLETVHKFIKQTP